MQISDTKSELLKIPKPKISIGIPVYNGDSYLDSAIESVLNQNFIDFELIISDNASTDKTDEICKKFEAQDNRIRYFKQKFNLGGTNNFKFVLDKSIGRYFMWLAADDIFGNKDFLKILNDELSEKYNYYFPEVSIIDNKGEIVRSNAMTSFKHCKTQLDFFEVSLKENAMHLYSLFLRENLIKDWKYLELCKKFPSCGEGLFVHAINATRKGKFVHKAIKLYRNHQGSWSGSTSSWKLIYSQLAYAARTIQFIFNSMNLTKLKKMIFSIKVFYLSSKALFYFIAYGVWRFFGLEKFTWLKKIINRLGT